MSSDTLYIKRLRRQYANPTGTFNRPANTTTYALGDLVANSTTPGSVAAMQITVASVGGGACALRRVKLRKSTTPVTNAAFTVWFFTSAPTSAVGDNDFFSCSGAANFVGFAYIGGMQTFTDGAVGFGVPSTASEIGIKLPSGTVLHVLISVLAAYAPGNAETFTVHLDVEEQL